MSRGIPPLHSPRWRLVLGALGALYWASMLQTATLTTATWYREHWNRLRNELYVKYSSWLWYSCWDLHASLMAHVLGSVCDCHTEATLLFLVLILALEWSRPLNVLLNPVYSQRTELNWLSQSVDWLNAFDGRRVSWSETSELWKPVQFCSRNSSVQMLCTLLYTIDISYKAGFWVICCLSLAVWRSYITRLRLSTFSVDLYI